MRSYPAYRSIYNHIDEIWSIDLAVFLDYKTLNNKGFRYIFNIIENFFRFLWCIPLKKTFKQ